MFQGWGHYGYMCTTVVTTIEKQDLLHLQLLQRLFIHICVHIRPIHCGHLDHFVCFGHTENGHKYVIEIFYQF